MGQQEVIKVLERRKIWLSVKELSLILKTKNTALVNRALRKLFQYNEILRREVRTNSGSRIYEYLIIP